jgi:hypothetical protein
MSDNNQNPSRSKPQLPEPTPTNGGPAKVPFDESLLYITGTRKEGLSHFRRFLIEGKGWSLEEVDTFLATMADRWPPAEYPLITNLFPTSLFPIGVAYLDLSPFAKSLLNHPASSILEEAYGIGRSDHWLDYGGFVRAHLPALRAFYSKWWNRQLDRTENLHAKKEKHSAPKKLA